MEDALTRGCHGAEDPIVVLGESSIGAGRGVFAVVPLRKGDIVTRLSMRVPRSKVLSVKESKYAIKVNGAYWVG